MRKYFDPHILARLQKLEFKARLVVEGHMSGMHKSPYKGFSVEFAEHKSYVPGDDIRYIDWKIYAKTGKFFIKQFEEDTNLKCYLVLDTSASMGFKNKLDYGSFLTVALSYLMLSQNDSVGLVTFNKKIVDYVPPRNNVGHLQNIVDTLENISPSDSTDIHHSLDFLASKMKRRGLVVLISDLIGNQTEILNHLKHLRRMKHELVVMHLIHPDEINLPYQGTVRFKNMEGIGDFYAIPDRIRKDYKKRLKNYIDTYQTKCWHDKIDYNRMQTDIPVEDAILKFFAGRKSF